MANARHPIILAHAGIHGLDGLFTERVDPACARMTDGEGREDEDRYSDKERGEERYPISDTVTFPDKERDKERYPTPLRSDTVTFDTVTFPRHRYVPLLLLAGVPLLANRLRRN